MPTYKEALSQIPNDDARAKALDNCEKPLIDRTRDWLELGPYLHAAFAWHGTSEGLEYWGDIYDTYKDIKIH